MPKFGELVRLTMKDRPSPHQPPRPDSPGYGLTTQKVIELIEQTPGASVAYLIRQGINPNTAGTLPYSLVRKGKLKARRLDGKMRFYPLAYRFSEEIAAEKPHPMSRNHPEYGKQTAAIMELLTEPLTIREIKQRTGFKSGTVSSTMHRLKNAQRVVLKGGKYSLTEAAQIKEATPINNQETEALVKEYIYHAWETNQPNPSLRDFLTWLKEDKDGQS